jgi:hypothetical protein
MAMKGSISFVEQHLEKGVLGIAGLFVLGVGVYFLGLGPNKVDFNGQKVGPRELDDAILRQGQELKRTIETKKPQKEDVPAFATELRQQFEAGIFGAADKGPAVPRELPVPAQFAAALPATDEQADKDHDVVLVTPLKPNALATSTGISLAVRQQTVLGEDTPAGSSADDEDPVELSWVSVGAYFPLDTQQREMTKAGYAGHRAKVYLVGVDMQRQELTASGDYSEWVDVEPSKAMPKFDVPNPVYDNKTGELLNQAELDAKLELVKASQQQLIQATFYPVAAGDQWVLPPVPGHEPKEDADAAEPGAPRPGRDPNKQQPGTGHKPQAPGPTPPPPPTPGGGRVGPGAGGGGRMGGGGRTGGGGAPPPPTPGASQQPPAKDKEVKENIKQARAALNKKEYDEAVRLARSAAESGDATAGEKAQANQILKAAEKGLLASTKTHTVAQRETIDFVRNPGAENEPAVWFHDDSVQPGKTYRYRMRVKIWNRYVGRRSALRDPAQADQTVLEGDWSLPSAPVTVAPRQHFFVRGQALGEPAASVDVFTWHKGTWLKEDFKVRVGDVIGGPVEVKANEGEKQVKEKVDFSTHAIVLDLRTDEPIQIRRAAGKEGEFAYREAKSLVLVYLDPADGQVKERISDLDRADPQYKKLKDEFEAAKGG